MNCEEVSADDYHHKSCELKTKSRQWKMNGDRQRATEHNLERIRAAHFRFIYSWNIV